MPKRRLLVLGGLGLAAGEGWAPRFAIMVVGLNFIAQLGFLGNTQNPPGSLTGMTRERTRCDVSGAGPACRAATSRLWKGE